MQSAPRARSSHERWDGNGYPDGPSRIVFVADAFCAMTEERPYARALLEADARRELHACSGTQFDPRAELQEPALT